jgi:hypothetical protein
LIIATKRLLKKRSEFDIHNFDKFISFLTILKLLCIDLKFQYFGKWLQGEISENWNWHFAVDQIFIICCRRLKFVSFFILFRVFSEDQNYKNIFLKIRTIFCLFFIWPEHCFYNFDLLNVQKVKIMFQIQSSEKTIYWIFCVGILKIDLLTSSQYFVWMLLNPYFIKIIEQYFFFDLGIHNSFPIDRLSLLE